MLTDEIKKSIKQLKQLNVVESAVQDAEKKIKNDNDFSFVVSDFSLSMRKLSYACNELNFILSNETLEYAEEIIDKLENVISAGAVDEEELVAVKQHIKKKVTFGLSKEWKTFYQQRTSGIAGKLATIGNLVEDQEKIAAIRTNILNGSDWTGLSLKDDGISTRLQMLKSGICEVEQIEKSLDLCDEIKDFVISVTRGKGKVTDINDTIIEWIKKENLEDKFVINFKNQ